MVPRLVSFSGQLRRPHLSVPLQMGPQVHNRKTRPLSSGTGRCHSDGPRGLLPAAQKRVEWVLDTRLPT